MARLTRFEWACVGLIALGLATRLLVYSFRVFGYDSAWYLTMGRSLVEHGEFVSPWIDPPPHTWHFPPGYPLVNAAAFAIAGPGFLPGATVAVLVAAFLAAVTFLTTRDLYGRARAFAATAVVMTMPILAEVDLQLLSESLVVAFFALTIWALLRSLDDPRFVVLAGLFAGLGYLTKASMGPFFLLAGAGGFLWRFSYVRWRVFRDKWYMLAAGLFALCVLPWAYRNLRYHGSWETQPHASEAIRTLFAKPDWPLHLGAQFLWGAVVLSALALAFAPEIARSFRRIREERTSALWLAVVTPSVIGLIFAAGFTASEGRPVVADTTTRYLLTPLIPLLWLGIRELPLEGEAPRGAPEAGRDLLRGRFALLAIGTGIVAFLHFANPTYPFLSEPRLVLYCVGVVLGTLAILAARAYAWTPAERTSAAGARSWRAVRERIAGAPSVAFALLALAFALGIGLWRIQTFFVLLVPLAASLAAGTPKARVIVLAGIAAMVPLASFQGDTPFVRAVDDLNGLAQEGDAVVAQPGHEFFVYPLLREDLTIVPPHKDHEWFVVYHGSGSPAPPGPGYELVREYTNVYGAGPGAKLGLALWPKVFDDAIPIPEYVTTQIYRRAEATP